MKPKSKLCKNVVGKKHFKDKIDVTDPCYRRSVWCRLNDVAVETGDYECVYWTESQNANCHVKVAGIYLNGTIPAKMKYIGSIGVDSGLAGFFDRKDDYNDDQWEVLCKQANSADSFLRDDGFVSTSGCGDGSYPVYASVGNDGGYNAVELRFIEN